MTERLSAIAREDDEFEKIIIENMRPSFVYETSGEDLGEPHLGGEADIVPHEAKPLASEQEPFGVSLARKLGRMPLEKFNETAVITVSPVGTIQGKNTDSTISPDD